VSVIKLSAVLLGHTKHHRLRALCVQQQAARLELPPAASHSAVQVQVAQQQGQGQDVVALSVLWERGLCGGVGF
jgi:hypothetical protein